MITKLTQKNRHNPDAGIWGDCWRTCIAVLLGFSNPEEVPHFCDSGATGEASLAACQKYLSDFGFSLVQMAWECPPEGILNWSRISALGVPVILSGLSRNKVNHSVVIMDGEIWCDPSIDQSGIIGPCDDGYSWIEFIVVNRSLTGVRP